MLFLRYCSFLLPLAVVFGCFSCESASTKKAEVPAVDTLSQRLDSIGFEPYVQSLITEGKLNDYELVDTYAMYKDAFFKDSLYLVMQESDWAFYGVYWIYSNKSITFSSCSTSDGKIIFHFENHLPDFSIYNYEFATPELTHLKNILDSVKFVKQDLNYKEGDIICSRLKFVYYDSDKFYYMGNHHGESAKFFMEQLFTIFSKYNSKS